jgi:short-subunit dehydrogenase
MKKLRNETVLITGAGSGFGRGTAFELARRGYHVIAATETDEQKSELANAAKKDNIDLRIEKLDITDVDDRLRAEDWDIDVLINNAGIAESGPLAEIPMEHVRQNFEVNVFGTLSLTQSIVKGMLKKGYGKIIIVSSVAGRMTAPYLGPYCMTKHALEATADVLRAELESHNIKVSIIEPGPYSTGFNERMNKSKYKWYGKDSIFASDDEEIKKTEQWLISNQFDPAEVINTLVSIVEDPNPKFRICIPKEWEETLEGVVCSNK